MRSGNPYLEQVHTALPRLLALFDTDPLSPTFGQGDRLHWAWKLKDFGNGTFQGAAHGLSRLIAHEQLPDWFEEKAALRRIDAMFMGAASLTRRNGSLEEAFPYESSFCVTALVAYDLLSAIELLRERLSAEKRADWLRIVEPLIGFLHRAEETHAMISNHLATAAAALFRWSALTGREGEGRGADVLRRILANASDEGWFREYEGADPGYQTLCLHYLSDLHDARPDLRLREFLGRAFRFLWHFAHPDGSFGGLYGSRNTRFYFPAAALALSEEIPEAGALARFMRQSVSGLRTVTLASVDESSLIPMFNNYCWAAALDERRAGAPAEDTTPLLPCESAGPWQKVFPSAGLLVDRGKAHYTIISWHKGGVCYHFPPGGGSVIDPGVVARLPDGRLYSTQAYDANNHLVISPSRLEVRSRFSRMHKQVPRPWQFIALRILNVTLMRFPTCGEWVKRALVRMLITGRATLRGVNERVILLGEQISISDRMRDAPPGLSRLEARAPFSCIHMASQGNWQIQDEQDRQ